ncbi:MAG TPA: DNA polymerase Y family protein [Sphingomicrobium sp.]|nr:DNA polymerase Y family protein [Sphingomicrobium sp.]
MAPRRILSICWPRLAIERWQRLAGGEAAEAEARVALVVEAQHGQMIHAATDAAQVRAGTRLTDARALDPGLIAVAADLAGDAALVERLARWAGRWSPLVEVDGEDGLRLDVSGVAHLFGGEAGLCRDVEQRFAGLGLTVRVAVAETAGAAWALARFAAPLALANDAKLVDVLAPLPVAALRLPPGPTRTLERLGLKTIGQLAGVPRRSLARRFREADNPLDALDRMLGRKPEPLTAAPFEPPPRALLRLAEPVVEPSVGTQALDLLVPGLVRILEARRLGARRLALSGYRVDGSIAVASVATALPSREPKHLARLLADRVAALDPGFGFDGFALEASWCEPLGGVQESLVDEPSGTREVALLIDRLSVKLGAGKVRRPQARASHVPERASGWRAGVAEVASPPRQEQERVKPPRPQRLLDAPEAIAVIYATPEGLPRRFVWRRLVHDIALVEGPERISPEWWRERGSARLRDYYRVEDQTGRRYWIFREGVHGDGRGGVPVWYLHGLFG